MEDIFDNPVLCKNCNIKMDKIRVLKNGFSFRTLMCKKCSNKIVHPEDKQEYQNFLNLKNKNFSVKMRMVGNSYTVSIPKEIANFINEQNKLMNDMVRLNLEKMGKLSLIFNPVEEGKEDKHD